MKINRPYLSYLFYLLSALDLVACASDEESEIITETNTLSKADSCQMGLLFYPNCAPADSTTVDWANDGSYPLTYSQNEIGLNTDYKEPSDLGQIKRSNLNEASGLAEGIQNPNLLWCHNDSGGSPILYGIDKTNGEHLGLISMTNASNKDWEDVSVMTDFSTGKSYIYAADIGDNSAIRSFLKIYKVEEPVLANGSFQDINLTAEVIQFSYPDGPRDAEALLVDPISKDIIIISKREMSVHVYALPYPQSTSTEIVATKLGQLPFREAVAADISSDGKHVIIKTYGTIYHWQRQNKEHIKYLLATKPERLKYELEVQGESIAWSNNTQGYYTLSESDGGQLPQLYYYQKKESLDDD